MGMRLSSVTWAVARASAQPSRPLSEAATLLFLGLQPDHVIPLFKVSHCHWDSPSPRPACPSHLNCQMEICLRKGTGKVPSGSQCQITETAAWGCRSTLRPPSPHVSHIQVTGHFLKDGQSGGQGRSVFPWFPPECGPYKGEGVQAGLSVLRTQQGASLADLPCSVLALGEISHLQPTPLRGGRGCLTGSTQCRGGRLCGCAGRCWPSSPWLPCSRAAGA